MDKLAIVILNWNGQHMLREYLPSVLSHSKGQATVYVADNNSSDNSVETVKTLFPEVRLIVLDHNYGFAEGYNKALKQVDAEYFLLLNSDIEVTPGWLNPLLAFMDAHPDYAACQPKLLSMYKRNAFEYAGACGGFIDRLGYPFCRGRIFNTVETDRHQYDTMCDIHWATGACLLIRRTDYVAQGGLDGRFFAHSEEIDLCWRLRIAGRRIACIPQSHVYHVGGGTLPKSNPQKTYLNFRNNLTMLYKNLPEKQYSAVMRWRTVLDAVAAVQSVLSQHNFSDFKAIFRARRDFNQWKKEFEPLRQDIQKKRNLPPEEDCASISILWQYYLKGRKTFGKLQF